MTLKQIYDRMQETKYISSNSINGRKFIFKLNRHLIEGICNAINFVRTHIASLNKKSLKSEVSFLSDETLRLPCILNIFSCTIQL